MTVELARGVTLTPVQVEDAESLADLRVQAMRESLVAVGRFDPDRARRRFLDTFHPEHTLAIELQGTRVGFYVLTAQPNHLALDHLYLAPSAQGRNIGTIVIEYIKRRSTETGLPIKLGALRESRSNGFYQSHGFRQIGEAEFDIFYEWAPAEMDSVDCNSAH